MIEMKNKIIILLMVILLSGCGKNIAAGNSQSTQTISNAKENGDNSMNKIEMTEQEIKILCETYSNEESIKEGKLYEYQTKQLKRIRTVSEYLKEKYGEEFTIIRCWESPDDRNGYRFDFINEKSSEVEYTAYVNADDDSDIKDNYYEALLSAGYDEWLSKELSDLLGQKVLTYTNFTSYFGSEFNGKEGIDGAKRMGNSLSRNSYIYLNSADGLTENAERIYELVQKENLYGAYFLYAEDGVTETIADGVSLRQLQQSGKSFDKNVSFQTWNEFKEN